MEGRCSIIIIKFRSQEVGCYVFPFKVKSFGALLLAWYLDHSIVIQMVLQSYSSICCNGSSLRESRTSWLMLVQKNVLQMLQ